jgi:tRNA pseudouridine13 synthase
MKDRHAVTRQWLSFFGTDPDRVRAVEVEGIRVISTERHQHKLRVGHLRGNRFTIRLRGADPAKLGTAQAVLKVLASVGCPNYFGEQRFGRGGETYTDARRWLIDEGRAPRSRFKRKLLVSTLQSHAFNAVVADRVVAQTLDQAIAGDVLKKEDSGGLFVCTDVSADQARVRDWQVSPTGPMYGRKMSRAEGTVGEYETKIFETEGFTDEVLRRFGKLGLGTRRPLRVQPHGWSVDADDFGLLFKFHLSPGSYATTLLREVRKRY